MSGGRINAGRSRLGWSFFEQVGVCDQAFAYDRGAFLFPPLGGVENGPAQPAPLPHGAVPSAAPALIRGGLLHQALAHYYMRLGVQRAGKVQVGDQIVTKIDDWMAPTEALRDLASSNDRLRWEAGYAPAWEDQVEIVLPFLKSYTALAGVVDEKLTPIAVEAPFEWKIEGTSPIYPQHTVKMVVTTRLDLVTASIPTNHVYIEDHKTSARADDSDTRSYGMSGQIAIMRNVGKLQWGDRFGGVWLRRCKWTVPHAFKREPPIDAPWVAATMKMNLIHRAAHVLALAKAGLPIDEFPKAAHPEVCEGKWGACPHMARCRFGPGG